MTDCFPLRLKDIQLLVLINPLHIHLCGKYFVTVASSTAINSDGLEYKNTQLKNLFIDIKGQSHCYFCAQVSWNTLFATKLAFRTVGF